MISVIIPVIILSTILTGCMVKQEHDDFVNQWNPEYSSEYSVNVTNIVDGDTIEVSIINEASGDMVYNSSFTYRE